MQSSWPQERIMPMGLASYSVPVCVFSCAVCPVTHSRPGTLDSLHLLFPPEFPTLHGPASLDATWGVSLGKYKAMASCSLSFLDTREQDFCIMRESLSSPSPPPKKGDPDCRGELWSSVLLNLGEAQTDQGAFLTVPSMQLSLVFLKIPRVF